MATKKVHVCMDEQLSARARFFPGYPEHFDEDLGRLPTVLWPYYRVDYRSPAELDLAKSVEPRSARIEYRYVGS